MSLLDDLLKGMNKDVAGEGAGGAGTPAINPVALPRENPFPRGTQGELINPQYIQTEGERIRQSLAEGTYGEQPRLAARAAQPEQQITIAPASGLLEGQPPIVFEQSSWNIDPAQEMQNLRLDELRTRAAQHKMELEHERTGLPKTELEAAQLEHTLAATRAIGTTERRRALENAKAMQDVAGFNEYMMNAPEPGTPEYVKHVRTGLGKYPSVATTQFGIQELGRSSKGHDIAAAIRAAALVNPPPGMRRESVGAGPEGPSVKFTSEKGVEKIGGISADDIATSVRTIVGTPVGGKDFDPAKPTAIKQDNAGTHVAIVTPEGKTKVIPIEVYQKLGGTLSPETMSARKIDMARKALNDPHSSEEHRAAARRILSGQ